MKYQLLNIKVVYVKIVKFWTLWVKVGTINADLFYNGKNENYEHWSITIFTDTTVFGLRKEIKLENRHALFLHLTAHILISCILVSCVMISCDVMSCDDIMHSDIKCGDIKCVDIIYSDIKCSVIMYSDN